MPPSAAAGAPAAAAVQQCLTSMRAAEGSTTYRTSSSSGPHVAPILFSFLNAFLPLLGHIAAAQHHAVAQLRGWRPLSGLRRHHTQREERDDSASSMHCMRGPRPPRQAQRQYEAARALERAMDPLAAAEAFAAAVELDPRQAEWVSLAAKQWSDAMYMPGLKPEDARKYNLRAIELAERALQQAPDQAHGYIARCVSRGRLALLSDNRTKVHLACDAMGDAQRALELEPQNDYAHHLMGRWHYEMAGLNAIARTLVRLLFGAALMQGSYPQAAEHYRIATQLAPRTLVHRVEYGRCLIKVGRTREAVKELEEALTYEVDDLNAHLTKEDGRVLLQELLSSPAGRAMAIRTLGGPAPQGSGRQM